MEKNYHILIAKYHGPSNSSGSKVSITSQRFEQRITVPYDHTYNSAWEIAVATLKRLGYAIVGIGELKDAHAVISSTFKGPRDAVAENKKRSKR